MTQQRIHPDYDLHNGDKVVIDNYDGSQDFCLISYDADEASFLLKYYTDSSYAVPQMLDEEQQWDYIHDIGLESIKSYSETLVM